MQITGKIIANLFPNKWHLGITIESEEEGAFHQQRVKRGLGINVTFVNVHVLPRNRNGVAETNINYPAITIIHRQWWVSNKMIYYYNA